MLKPEKDTQNAPAKSGNSFGHAQRRSQKIHMGSKSHKNQMPETGESPLCDPVAESEIENVPDRYGFPESMVYIRLCKQSILPDIKHNCSEKYKSLF